MVWISKPIGEAVELMKTGSTPSTSQPEFFNGSIPWFTPGDIGDTRDLIKSTRYITKAGLATGKAKLFDKGMLLITCIGDIGRVGVLHQPSSANQQITVLKFKNDIDVNYAYYWFIANRVRLERFTNQAIVPILNNEGLKGIEFFYPPLPEQRRIAALLAKADRLRRLRRYADQLGETYLQSVFVEMFGEPATNPKGWKIGHIRDLCETILDCPHATPNHSHIETEFASIRSSDIQNGYLDWSTTKYVDYDQYMKRIARGTPKVGDIVYCREGARFGNAARIPGNLNKKICLGQRMMLFRVNPEKAISEFLWAILESSNIYKQAESMVGGSASPHVNVQDIKKFTTLIPPLPEQERFAAIVQRYERLRAQGRESGRQAEMLFQGLLAQSFDG